MRNFTKEEMRTYVETVLPNSEIISAKKVGNTIAVPATAGQVIETLEVGPDGKEFVERTAVCEEGDMILTKTGSNNQPVLNAFGHPNQYVVKKEKFDAMYEPSVDGPGLYSKSQIEKFIRSEEDLTFGTKYGEMTVNAGGYIKVSNLDSISGISEVSFNDTYVVIDTNKKTL